MKNHSEKEIEQLTKEWIDKGEKVIDEKYMKLWEKVVPIRISDVYNQVELSSTLEIIEMLNNGCRLSEAKKTFENQNSPWTLHLMICSMIRSLCDRGDDFFNIVLNPSHLKKN